MSRSRYTRRLPAAAVAAGLALALSACGGEAADTAASPASGAAVDQLDPNADLSKQSLTVTVWDGYTPKELPQEIKSKLKFDLKVTLHDTNEVAMAKLTSGADTGIDVAFVSGQYAQALNEAGLLEPLHPELIPNLANLYPEAKELAYDKGNTFSVPYTWGTTGICYREDLVKTKPASWNDILDPPAEAKKKVTMMTTERWLALPAIKALGYSVNTRSDEELAKVKEKLLAAKPNLLAYDDTTFGDRLKSGEAVMVEAWDGWCPTSEKNIKFVVPKEGSDLWVDTMVILKSSKNKEAAHAFINHILDPKVHGWAASNILYKVPNKAAMDIVDADLKAQNTPLQMSPADLLQGESIIDLGEDSAKFTRLATEVAAKQ
ncbi:spermidine/putrescine ABC transporter substrate-binding protein [Planomonospora parontospora subsp. parontospora]|uniref:Spermidine/putrescine ABC transporter substrate-binding protein n=2 Tax=Planomonospora parontospora TaxID=58119 RepID=A0AA37F5Q1_9ACTN|nr:spermidine/putrescine ABC transporter substrate-binding protein [Planomonospora parontospora]GGK75113.1 spermidine/putrescine ABC transporter substrate-binding protein [Planomonospora parontospora]GII09512.1 spermidine/putrescine ABC transporter substrate-binding protein [Planomonospora parontospora subsp. parontospora]